MPAKKSGHRTLPARPPGEEGDPSGAVRAGGFSLHAGVAIAPQQRGKLEWLRRYVSRPPVAEIRLALTASDQVLYGAVEPAMNRKRWRLSGLLTRPGRDRAGRASGRRPGRRGCGARAGVIRDQLVVRQGLPAARLTGPGTSTAASGSPQGPCHEHTGTDRWFEFPICFNQERKPLRCASATAEARLRTFSLRKMF